MEFGMFHEFPLTGLVKAKRDAFDRLVRAGRRCRSAGGLDVMWLAELHCAPERSVLAAPLRYRHRHRQPHETHENRHRRPGAAAVPPAAGRRRSDHRGSYQPRPPDHGCRPQRISAHVSGLWDFLCRKPGTVRGSHGNPQARLDAGELVTHGKSFDFEKCVLRAEAVRTALAPEIRVAVNSPDTFQEQGERFGNPIFVATRSGNLDGTDPQPPGLPRRVGSAAGHPGNGKVYLRVPVYIAEETKSRHARNRWRA